MPKTIDALTRQLLQDHPADWLALLGLIHGEPASVVNSDMSTVTAEADKVIRVDGPEPRLVHIELQTSFDGTLPRRLLRYNALLNLRHNLPVHTVAVLLRPEADGTVLDGILRQRSPDGRCSLEFQYHVVRAWELSTAAVLAGGPGVLPLAPITAATPDDVPTIIEELKQHYDPAGTTRDAADFCVFTPPTAGLRYEWHLIEDWFRGITVMRQSSAYEHFVAEGMAQGMKEGRIVEARELVLRLGKPRLGAPSEAIREKLTSINELDRLESLFEKLFDVADWEDLLGEQRG